MDAFWKDTAKLITTTHGLDGKTIRICHGIVSDDAIMGAHIFRGLFAGIRDIVGGRSAGYEKGLRKAKALAMEQMSEAAWGLGANAVVGVDLDYETVGDKSSVLRVVAAGTAVTTD